MLATKSIFGRRSLFLLLSLMLVFFYACHKETLDNLHQTSSSPNVKISVQDARKWFDERFKNGASINDDSTLFTATPIWDSAQHKFSQLGTEFLTVPLNLRLRGGRYLSRLLIRQDANGSLTGRYLVYFPEEDYHNRTNGYYSPLDFCGSVIYTDVNGNFTHGYKIVNGEITGSATAIPNNNRNNISSSTEICTVLSYCVELIAFNNLDFDCFDIHIGNRFW